MNFLNHLASENFFWDQKKFEKKFQEFPRKKSLGEIPHRLNKYCSQDSEKKIFANFFEGANYFDFVKKWYFTKDYFLFKEMLD